MIKLSLVTASTWGPGNFPFISIPCTFYQNSRLAVKQIKENYNIEGEENADNWKNKHLLFHSKWVNVAISNIPCIKSVGAFPSSAVQ